MKIIAAVIVLAFLLLEMTGLVPERVLYFWQYDQNGYLIVDDCDLDGKRKPNVTVDVGFDNRVYLAKTNEHAQLVEVTADAIELQHKWEEKSNGRYCWDEAKVPGTEFKEYDEGHVIADSLGGVSNAYNITPQHYIVNRKGKQYEIEEEMRQALYDKKSVTDVEVKIIYSNADTQIPDAYEFRYSIDGEEKEFYFENMVN